MKECKLCGKAKTLDEFGWRLKAKGIKSSYCKPCRREYDKNHWKKRSEASKSRKRKLSKERVREVRQYLFDWYKAHPCVDCGETDPRALQSDHLKDKKFAVSTAAGSGISIATLQEELKKCETRCASCHMKKTAVQLGWYDDLV